MPRTTRQKHKARAKTQEARSKRRASVTDEQERRRQRQAEGKECVMHSWAKHGKEAEELRRGIETIVAVYTNDDSSKVSDVVRDLLHMLDSVDARDSLAYLERKKSVPTKGKADR